MATEREILERAVRALADRARDAYKLVEEALAVEKPDSPLVLSGKRLRMELLTTNGELERELGRFLLHCRRCNRRARALGERRRRGARPLGAR